MIRQRICKCAVRDASGRVDNKTSGFVNDNQIRILIYNIDGNVFRREALSGRGRQFDFNTITGANFVGGFCLTTIHEDHCVFDQILQARTTPPIDTRRQKRIETLACCFGCYCKSAVRIVIEFAVHVLEDRGCTGYSAKLNCG